MTHGPPLRQILKPMTDSTKNSAGGRKGLVGLTTSVPVEVVFAAGLIPVDLNNLFITDPDPYRLVSRAEEAGFARSLCAWIKGIHSALTERPEITTLIAVTQGDCSNTHALVEILSEQVEVIRFDYPPDRDEKLLEAQIGRLIKFFNTTWSDAQDKKERLDAIRTKLVEMDRLTWEEGRVSGFENHLWQVSSSDFNSDPDKFEIELDDFLKAVKTRSPKPDGVRLGLCGIPPIMDGLYEAVEEFGGRVVFNEVQRQFAMPPKKGGDLIGQYRDFTYPYDVFARIEDIGREIEQRKIQGLIHYTQSFCFRQIQDILLRERLSVPILTIEGDRPGPLDARTRMRLEAFIDVVRV